VWEKELTAVRRQFTRLEGFDQVADAAAAWDLDFRLLGPGIGSGVIETMATSRALVQRHRFGWHLHQRGAAPTDFRTFGVGFDGRQEFPWNGQTIGGDWLLSFPEDGSFESVSGESFHVYTLSFREELVQRTAEVLGLPPVGEAPSATGASRLNSRSARGIRRTLRSVVQASRQVQLPGDGECHGLARIIEWDLLSQILHGIGDGQPTSQPRANLRAHALRRSKEFIEQAGGQPVTVRELCEASGASWRTLDYAFKERYGVTPKAYLRARRLNAAHAELRDMSPEEGTVASVAWRWGFSHQSRFAADFRGLFGELPSETLGREGGRKVRP